MLVATFNATTGWAGRQITWQDDRLILDGHGAITAFDLMGYDGQGQLDWPSEEMRSWAAARYSWEVSAATAAAAQPAYSQPVTGQPVEVQPVGSQPVQTQPAAAEPTVAEPAGAQPAAAEPAAPAQAVFGGSAAQSAAPSTETEPVTAEPAGTPAADEELAAVDAEAAADEIVVDEPVVTPAGGAGSAEPAPAASATAETGPSETAAETEPETADAEAATEPAAAAHAATPPAEEVRDVLAPGGDIQEVVGSAPFQEALETIAGGEPGNAPDLEKWAHLIPEPDNPWDRNAVAVYIAGRKIGYLARETSGAYAALLNQLWAGSRGRAVCRAVVSGGWRQVQSQVGSVTTAPEDQFGVRLALAAPERFDISQGLRQLTDEELKAGPPPI